MVSESIPSVSLSLYCTCSAPLQSFLLFPVVREQFIFRFVKSSRFNPILVYMSSLIAFSSVAFIPLVPAFISASGNVIPSSWKFFSVVSSVGPWLYPMLNDSCVVFFVLVGSVVVWYFCLLHPVGGPRILCFMFSLIVVYHAYWSAEFLSASVSTSAISFPASSLSCVNMSCGWFSEFSR